MMEQENVVTPWSSFHDGREYIVSLSIVEKPKSMSILITDKITAEEWSCQYDLNYVEDLTRKTGSYKSFDTFISMIKSAILKNTDSVNVELFSLEDLKALKSQRHRKGIVAMNEFVGSILKNSATKIRFDQDDLNSKRASLNETEKRKYLIVSYDAEFDSVHYPVPLNYSGLPDPLKMQINIKKLKSEISQLKSANVNLKDELRIVKEGNDFEDREPHSIHHRQPSSSAVDVENNLESTSNQLLQNYDINVQNLQRLVAAVQKLEDRLTNQRGDYLEQIERLENDNDGLCKHIEQLEENERSFLLKIKRLEQALSQFQLAKNKNGYSRSKEELKNYNRFRNHHNGNERGRHNAWKSDQLSNRRNTNSRSRTSSLVSNQSIPRPMISHRPPAGRQQSTSPARSGRRTDGRRGFFDPTAFVEQKKLKQEEIRKFRMAQIERQLDERRNTRATSQRANGRSLSNHSQRRNYDTNTYKDERSNAAVFTGVRRGHQSRYRFSRRDSIREMPVSNAARTGDVSSASSGHKLPRTFNHEPCRHTKSRLESRLARSQSREESSDRSSGSSCRRFQRNSSSDRPPKPPPTKLSSRSATTDLTKFSNPKEYIKSGNESRKKVVINPRHFHDEDWLLDLDTKASLRGSTETITVSIEGVKKSDENNNRINPTNEKLPKQNRLINAGINHFGKTNKAEKYDRHTHNNHDDDANGINPPSLSDWSVWSDVSGNK